MIRVGPLSRARVRAACYALRVRWVEELERQRDDARAAKGLALAQVAQVREAFEISQRARAKEQEATHRLDGAIEQARRALRETGHRVTDETGIGADVASAIVSERKAHQGSRDVPPRAARLINDGAWVHAVAGSDRGHVVFSGRALGYTSEPTFVIELSDGTRRSWVAGLVVEGDVQPSPPREAYDPAMGGDIEPPPGRDETAVVGCTCAQCRSEDVVEATVHCGLIVDGVECGEEDGHDDECRPSRRAIARTALVAAGIDRHQAIVSAQVLDEARLLVDRGRGIDPEPRATCDARVPGFVGRCFLRAGHDHHEAVPF